MKCASFILLQKKNLRNKLDRFVITFDNGCKRLWEMVICGGMERGEKVTVEK